MPENANNSGKGITLEPMTWTGAMTSGLGTVGFMFGVLSLVLCWWFPFGFGLSLAGVALCGIGWFTTARTGHSGSGLLLSAVGMGAGVILGYGSWIRVLGI